MPESQNLPLVRRQEGRCTFLRVAGVRPAEAREGEKETPQSATAQRGRKKVTPEDVAQLVKEGREHEFYCSPDWRKKRRRVLRRDKGECQLCKARGRYRKAVLVHHVLHLKDRPDLALCDTYTDGEGVERRQLISVCRECHETVCHPERMRKQVKERFVTQERWD